MKQIKGHSRGELAHPSPRLLTLCCCSPLCGLQTLLCFQFFLPNWLLYFVVFLLHIGYFFAIFHTNLQYLSLWISACSIYVTNKYPCVLLKPFPPSVNPAGCFRISPSAHRRAVVVRKVSSKGMGLHDLHCGEKFCFRVFELDEACSEMLSFFKRSPGSVGE